MTIPDRVRWAIESLDADPADMLLEIGSGPGVAAGLACDRLRTGRLLAIDRSAVAVRRTAERNAAHVASGRLVVRQSSLEALQVPPAHFDKAFAINVNLFWVRDPSRELDVLRRGLCPHGVLHVAYGANGPTSADRVTSSVAAALARAGFTDVTITTGDAAIGISGRAPAATPATATPAPDAGVAR